MPRETKHEKHIIATGGAIITWEHEDIVDYLLQIFQRDLCELTLRAVADNTKRRTLTFILDSNDLDCIQRTNFGGSVIYNKKKRQFTHIQYSDRYNWIVQFSIASRSAFFARDFYNQIKHKFPFGWSTQKLTNFFLSTDKKLGKNVGV